MKFGATLPLKFILQLLLKIVIIAMFRQALRSSTTVTRHLKLTSQCIAPRSKIISQQPMREQSTVTSVYSDKTHRRVFRPSPRSDIGLLMVIFV